MNDAPIGVFDSGLGGLTVLQALADLLPDEDLVYVGDTARYPYGPRSREELTEFSLQIADFLVAQGAKMIVIACNSASAAARDALREHVDIPVIGVVEPGVRAAVRATRTGKVAVIGTQMTIDSKIYQHASEQLRTGLEIIATPCQGFVELVESGDTLSENARAVVARELAPLRDTHIDTLVLGCTHYPLLARAISDELGRDVTLVSSADETAFDVREILERTGWARAHRDGGGDRVFHTSGDAATFRELGERFLGWSLPDVRAVSFAGS